MAIKSTLRVGPGFNAGPTTTISADRAAGGQANLTAIRPLAPTFRLSAPEPISHPLDGFDHVLTDLLPNLADMHIHRPVYHVNILSPDPV